MKFEIIEDDWEVSEITEIRKCPGFRLLLKHPDEVYSRFPFTLIPDKNLTFENGSFHHEDCVKKNYVIYNPHMEHANTYKSCFNLKFSPI